MSQENTTQEQSQNSLARTIHTDQKKETRPVLLFADQETPASNQAQFIHRTTNATQERQRLVENGSLEEARAFEKVVAFAQAVKDAKGQALLVGGSVRDELMGIPPKDYDIEVYGIPPEKLKMLAHAFGKVNEVGASFGILKVQIGDMEIDVSLPRRESKTGKGHRDFSISADPTMSIKEAARRRDFTCNSLAKDVLSGTISDYFGGVKDIAQKILRVTDEKRFRDDPLRVLRGVQFVGRFGMSVDDRTAMIMREMRSELKHLPKERLREEWIKLFLRSKKPSFGLQAAMEWGIFHEHHPEVVALACTPQETEWHPEGDVWIHTLMVVDEAARIVEEEQFSKEDALIVLLAAFCHDFGKPLTTEKSDGKIRALGHEEAGVAPTQKFLSSIGIESSLQKPINKLVAEHLKPSQFYIQEVQRGQKISDGAIKRLAGRIHPGTLKQLISVAKSDHRGRGPFVDPAEPKKSFMPFDYPAGEWLMQRAASLNILDVKPQPVLFGRDLIALGFAPGPLFGAVITAAEDLHEKGFSREEILSLVAAQKAKPLTTVVEILKNTKTPPLARNA